MELKINTESLKESQISFQEEIPSHYLFTQEKDLSFADTLKLSGKAYLAGDHLMLEFNAQITAYMPCCICNKPTPFTLKLSHFTHAEPLEDIPGRIFDYTDLIRTSLLLELPQFLECFNNCPERENVKKFLKNSEISSSQGMQFPFSNL